MANQTLTFRVTGEQQIHCAGCAERIGTALRRVPGVADARAGALTQGVRVTIAPARVGPEQVRAKLAQLGYQATPEGGRP